MSDTLATSFGVLNYSGMLFNKGNTRCPLSSIIGGRAKTTNHVEFVTGQEYTTGGGEQPAISETASLTAPEASVITRTQKTNDSDFHGGRRHFLCQAVQHGHPVWPECCQPAGQSHQ